MLENVAEHWRPLAIVLGLTGLRWGKATGLRWDDLELDGPAAAARIRRSNCKARR